jgi:quercetin dioxygenase-like cupin family protein
METRPLRRASTFYVGVTKLAVSIPPLGKPEPSNPGSRIDFVRYQISPSTVLGPTTAHAPGTMEHVHVAAGTVRVTVGDETADLAAGDSRGCRTDAHLGSRTPTLRLRR